VPAWRPERLTPVRVATPAGSAVAVPTTTPLRVKVTVSPGSGVAREDNAAETVTVPP
jgi:hypothetical protein